MKLSSPCKETFCGHDCFPANKVSPVRDSRRSRGQLIVTAVKQMWWVTAHTGVFHLHTHKPQQHWLHTQPPSDCELTRVTGATHCGPLCVMWWQYRTFSTNSSTLSPGFSGWVHPAEMWRHKAAGQFEVLHFSSGSCLCTRTRCRSFSMKALDDGQLDWERVRERKKQPTARVVHVEDPALS